MLQSSLLPLLEIGGATPNLLLILTVSFGLMRGRAEGMWIGFFCGFLYDVYFGYIIGPYMLLFALIGYINGFFHRFYMVEDLLLPIFIILADDFLYNFATYVVFFLMRNRLEFKTYMTELILPEMVYTALFTLIIFKLFVLINKGLKRLETQND